MRVEMKDFIEFKNVTKTYVIGDEKYNANEMSEYRVENVGFIFQFYNILPTLTVLENVEIVKEHKNVNDIKICSLTYF